MHVVSEDIGMIMKRSKIIMSAGIKLPNCVTMKEVESEGYIRYFGILGLDKVN